MFGKKKRKFESDCVQFIEYVTDGAVSEKATKIPMHYQADFRLAHIVGKSVEGSAWPTQEGSENAVLEIFKRKMWWLQKHHDAVFEQNFSTSIKIQEDHLTGNKKLFVHELLELHYLFGRGVLSKISFGRIPSHFENRVASLSSINMPFYDDVLSLHEWVKLPKKEKLNSLK